MADTSTTFTIVEDHDDDSFFIVLPDGTETEPCGNDEIAMADDGARTYIAANCDDFPGMKAGVVYAVGEAMPTTVVDAEEYDSEDAEEEEETEVDAEPGEDAEEEEEEIEEA